MVKFSFTVIQLMRNKKRTLETTQHKLPMGLIHDHKLHGRRKEIVSWGGGGGGGMTKEIFRAAKYWLQSRFPKKKGAPVCKTDMINMKNIQLWNISESLCY